MVIGLLHVNKVRTCFAGGAACKLSIQDLHYYCSIITLLLNHYYIIMALLLHYHYIIIKLL